MPGKQTTKKTPVPPGKGKVKISTPKEYVVLVGGPSDMYSGWFYGRYKPQRPPVDVKDIARYINEADDPRYGAPETHDLYWANFLQPVPRLFSQGYAEPSPGDIVTVMVYAPPFEVRQALDWEASDHNPYWEGRSPWVPRKTPPKKAPASSGDDWATSGLNPLRLGPEWEAFIREQKGRPKPEPRVQPKPKPAPFTEERINHEIMMRKVSDTEKDRRRGIFKRPLYECHWMDILSFFPKAVRGGSMYYALPAGAPDPCPALLGTMVKVLLVYDMKEIFEYLTTGKWEGMQRCTFLDSPPLSTEEDQRAYDEFWASHALDGNWDALGDLSPFKGVTGPKMDALRALWDQCPAVDRSKIKIAQLNYFGHANGDGLFLAYGTENAKGEEPEGEVILSTDDLMSAIRGKKLFTKSASASLWGCSLGDRFAPVLSEEIPVVWATESLTTYDYILSGDDAMPEPSDGSDFKFYQAGKAH